MANERPTVILRPRNDRGRACVALNVPGRIRRPVSSPPPTGGGLHPSAGGRPRTGPGPGRRRLPAGAPPLPLSAAAGGGSGLAVDHLAPHRQRPPAPPQPGAPAGRAAPLGGPGRLRPLALPGGGRAGVGPAPGGAVPAAAPASGAPAALRPRAAGAPDGPAHGHRGRHRPPAAPPGGAAAAAGPGALRRGRLKAVDVPQHLQEGLDGAGASAVVAVDEGDGAPGRRRVGDGHLHQRPHLQLALDGHLGHHGDAQPLLHHALGGLQRVQLHGHVGHQPRLPEVGVDEAEVAGAPVVEDEGLGGHLLQGDPLAAGEGVVAVHHQGDLVLVKGDGVHIGVVDGPHQPHLHLVTQHHLQHLLRPPRADGDVDARVALAEDVQDLGQDVGADGEGRAQAQVPQLQATHLLHRVPGLLHDLQDAQGIGEEGLAGVGQPHPPSAALEQLLPQLPLQRLDAGGDGGLSELEGLGGLAEAVELRYLHERFYLTQVHGYPPARRIDATYHNTLPCARGRPYSLAR